MKKIIVLMLSFVLILTSLAACSSNNEEAGNNDGDTNAVSSNTTGEEEQVEITFWRHDFEVEAESFKKLIASFEEEYPNIKVKLELFPNDQYETKIRTALAGQSAPDIIAIDGPTLASYAHNGALIPLDDYMNKDGNKDDIAEPVLESLTYDGKIYAAPNNDASLAMFYNKKMFEEAGIALPSKDADEPWTWEQVLDAAKILNDPENGVYGWNPNPWGFAGHEGVPFMDMTYLWQAGAEILSPDKSTAKGYLDSEASKQALTFFKSLYNSEGVAPKELPQDAFANGKVAIHVDGPWAFSALEANFPDFKLGEDYDVAPLWKGVEQVTPNGSWNLGITSQSEHPDEAWLFVNWATGIEGSKVWYEDTKNLPARLSTADAFPELKEYPMNIFVEQSAKYAKPRPVTPAYPAVSEAVRLLFEEVGLGDSDVDEATAKAVQKIEDGISQMN
jgi:fructooligosaccharide transport system substrate-binding protein